MIKHVSLCLLKCEGLNYTVTWGGGVTPLYGLIGMCSPKWYGFSAILVINRGPILAMFVINMASAY